MTETRNPDIGKMIEEELKKGEPSEQGKKPLEVTPEGAIREAEAPADAEVDEAFERIQASESAEATSARKIADLGAAYSRRIQLAFEKGGAKDVDAIAREYVAAATAAGGTEDQAKAVLREQIKGYHDTYLAAGLDAKAAELDAFGRSLESASEVKTQAGKEFLAKLDAGGFPSIVEANEALDRIAKGAKGAEADALNAEFNVLFGKAQEWFSAKHDRRDSGIDMKEEDIDDVLSALG